MSEADIGSFGAYAAAALAWGELLDSRWWWLPAAVTFGCFALAFWRAVGGTW